MKAVPLLFPFLVCLTLCPGLRAQNEAFTDPVGFVSVTVPAQSDAVLAVPLNRSSSFRGVLQSVTGNQLTVMGTPGWANNELVQNLPTQTNTYAVLIATGAKEGLIARITANGTNVLSVQLEEGENLSGVKTESTDPGAADRIDIVPYWTPSSLISGSIPEGTEMYIFDNTAPGQNVSPTVLLQYFDGFGWYETIGFTDQSHRPMLFGRGFILRNKSPSPITPSFVGSVPMAKNRLILRTLSPNTNQDQTIGYMSPIPEPLSKLGLGAENRDELYLFDNSTSGYNKSPALLLVFFDGRWYNSVTFADVTDSTTIQPGIAMIYRKVSTGAPQAFVWQDLQSYLSP